MPRTSALTRDQLARIRDARSRSESIRAIARDLGLSPSTVTRALSRTRTASEFRGASTTIKAPQRATGSLVWSLEQIRQARDEQMIGRFKTPVRLAEALRTDDALYTAYHNRVGTQSAVDAKLVPHESTRGKAVTRKAAEQVIVPRSVLKGIHGTLANHGIAIGYNTHEIDDEGTRVCIRHTEWPLEHVYYDATAEQLMTYTHAGPPAPVVHGDGRWTVYRKFHALPWTQEAAILPGAFIWGAHSYGLGDWAASANAHAMSKIVGELPQGSSLQEKSEDGQLVLTPEAQGFLDMMRDLVTGNATAGIRPHGSKIDFIHNGSNAYQIFADLIENREKAAARIYLGTDAILGSVGGAPGIDIAQLFRIASLILQGDFDAIEQGLFTGVYEPWAAINEGDSRYAPFLEYQLPDPDADAKSKQRADARERLMAAVERMRAQRFEVTQEIVDALAKEFGVSPAPTLAAQENAKVPLPLAPTDVARVVRVREARASQDLPPLGDDRDELMISELEAKAEAKADATAGGIVAPTAPAPAAPPA